MTEQEQMKGYHKAVYEYDGFESASDIERDMSEIWDEFDHLPGEWEGTLRITVEYIPEEGEFE